jgi:hypothetical protein
MNPNEVWATVINFVIKVARSDFVINVAGSVIGGILVAIGSSIYLLNQRWFRHRRFKAIFGPDADRKRKFFITYGRLLLRNDLHDQNGEHPKLAYSKQSSPSRITRHNFSIVNPVSDSELRAANYIATSFGNYTGLQPTLKSDEEIESSDSPLDISFISLGGFSNWKSLDVLDDDANNFVKYKEGTGFVSKNSQLLAHHKESSFDYGLILKIHPNIFPKRVWIACIGYGEWGTSGAAYFLANKWKELSRKNFSWEKFWRIHSGNNFAAIVRVKDRQDQSATLIEYYRASQDVEKRSKELQESGATDNSEAEPHFPSSAASTSSSTASAASLPTTITIDRSQTKE